MAKKKDTSLGKNFVGKSRAMMQHPAFRDLRPIDRALLDELIFRFNGGNNGEIHLDLRTAATLLKSHPDTVGRAYKKLAEHGFIKLTRGDSWQAKKSREWRITCKPYNGQEPTNDWKKWEPGKPVFNVPQRYYKKTRT